MEPAHAAAVTGGADLVTLAPAFLKDTQMHLWLSNPELCALVNV